ncbi:hypothetical protein N7499_005958 [Penicillium canescens]|uniref:NADH-ubiquinone oxidoreductase 178 kDa subunit n=1 Tax=Penicillium canescens TaxID=5083 RepID=A0AAD6IDQ0_PENCN|nr:uncharacterized protein N7446_001730 [Penicillium canescens]KAJ5997647.1 hypothetical protein N7522_009307 [Penicillium canescens]KAJ6043532.1 hypothetical protein N7460_004887 [Penicillium canescens]KAJ6055006.1 hypothetical protein N7444_004104 [Penicillium canescens]KAJ6073953.1 hypothetical protein N7446_001730 [Penicillium canescens]KAJ6081084.1 hypothetical protein N7499_005958 [Penicillium canescens]
MFAARRSATSTRQLLRTQRRWGSHAAHEPVNEGVGRSFYVTVGSLASAYLLYRVSQSNQDSGAPSWISGLISKWTPSQETFEQRNAIHTAIMEKAAEDRHLLQSQGPREAYELKQPDMMNTGSPYNLAAGSRVDLSHVVAHYERKNQEIDEARAVRMKDGKSLYD